MPESVASLKRENSNLKDQLSVMADEIAKMKEMLQEQSKKPAATKDETVQSLEFMSKGFDDFERFRVFAGKELERLSAKLSLLLNLIEFPGISMNFKSIVKTTLPVLIIINLSFLILSVRPRWTWKSWLHPVIKYMAYILARFIF